MDVHHKDTCDVVLGRAIGTRIVGRTDKSNSMIPMGEISRAEATLVELQARLGYAELSEEERAWWDELVNTGRDIPHVMVKLAEELEYRDVSISEFFRRYQKTHPATKKMRSIKTGLRRRLCKARSPGSVSGDRSV